MPHYEFKGKDAKGVSTVGSIEAASHAAASATLKSRGVQVTMLRVGSVPAPQPPALTEAPPPTLKPFSGDLSRLSSSSLASQLPRVLAGLAVVALVFSYWIYGHFYGPWGIPQLSKADQTRIVEIKGRVSFDNEGKATDPWKFTRVTVVLPEVPAEFVLNRNELAINAVGDFTTKLHFLSPIVPQIANIIVSTRGYKSQVFAHRQLPPEAGKSLDLPPAVLQKMSGTPTTPRFRRGPNAGQTGAKPGAQSTPSRAQTDR